MKLTSKDFRLNRFFVLYDNNDNIVLFIDSTKELINVYKNKVKEIVRKFNNSNDNYITVIIDGTTYKLYTFTD